MANYTELAKQYAEGVLALMMPMSTQATHVSQRGITIASYQAVATQARQLLAVSTQLTAAAAERLTSSNPQLRVEIQLQMLAKALTDIALSQQLLDAAEDEKVGIGPQVAGASRTASLFDVNGYLKVVVNGFAAQGGSRGASRGSAAYNAFASTPGFGPANPAPDYAYAPVGAPTIGFDGAAVLESPAMIGETSAQAEVNSAKYSLSDAVGETLSTVIDQTSVQGQAAFRGLVSIGLFNLGKAAAVVGADIAKYLGYGAEVSDLYRLVNEYVGRAHETILTLLGRELSGLAIEKALDFFNTLKDGSLLGELLEKLYETRKTRDDLAQVVQQSAADLPSYAKAAEGLAQLREQFGGIMDFVGKLIKGLRFVGMIPAAAMPQAQLVMSASHAVLFTYIILAGADFADSQRIKMLNRVPGVRDLITTNLLSHG